MQHFDDLHLTAYLCPAGVPTIGYGHTGPDVRLGMRITEARADELLARDLDEAAADVNRQVRARLTPEHRGGLSSFVFNLGAGALASSTLLKRLNEGDYEGAAAQFGKWVYATVDGRKTVLEGLEWRRAAEAALFEGRFAAERGLKGPDDLAGVLLLHSLARPDDWARWLNAAGAKDVNAFGGIKYESSAMAYQAAVEGHGVAIAQKALVEDDLTQGRLTQPFALELDMAEFTYYFVFPIGRERKRELEVFRQCLKTQ